MQNKQQDTYLSLCLLGLILALIVPWIRLLLFIALFFYGAALGLYQEETKKLIRKLSVVFFFILSSSIPLIFARIGDGAGGNADTLVAWSSWGITKSGIELATLVSLRAITAFGAVLLMIQICPIYELFRRLKSSPYCPNLFVELLELVYRYIHVLDEMRGQIYEAQVCRLAYSGTYRERLQDMTMLISRTFVQAHSEVNKLYDGLVSRGFDTEDKPLEEDETELNTKDMNKNNELKDFIRLEGVSHEYEKKYKALEELNLTIQKGERIVLLGENGAGKSTLMKLLCGLLPLQNGSYHLAGRKLTTKASSLKELRSQVALVFQNANHQLFCASVEDEIAFGLYNLGLKEEDVLTRVEEIIQDFELQELRTIAPHKLSEGQKKWLSLAAILALDPNVILLDEPTASLDCYHQKKVLTLLSRLNKEGKTIILSTHDMDLAYEWGERVLVMNKGRLLADDKPQNIFEDKALLKKALLEEPYQLKQKVVALTEMTISTQEAESKNKDKHDLALFLKSKETNILFVGGGKAAYSKIGRLLERGAKISVLSPDLDENLRILHQQGEINYIAKEFEQNFELKPYQLIIAATGNKELDRLILTRAKENHKLYLSLSLPHEGNMHFSAQASTSGIDIAIHTPYRLPEISKVIKELLGESLPTDLAVDLKNLSILRERAIEGDAKAHEGYKALKDAISKKINYVWTNRN